MNMFKGIGELPDACCPIRLLFRKFRVLYALLKRLFVSKDRFISINLFKYYTFNPQSIKGCFKINQTCTREMPVPVDV